jgi:adenylate kinase
MIIAITGTPGTGKTSVSQRLSEITGYRLIGLNGLAQEKGLYVGTDRKRGCRIVDVPALRREIGKIGKDGRPAIIESHFAHDMPADLVVVLRTSPGEIRKRAASRGWSSEKTEENAEAEIMEVCRSEALESGKDVEEIDTTGKSVPDAAEEAALILQKHGLFVAGDLAIGEETRKRLREPYGKLFTDFSSALAYMKGGPVFSVGDRVSRDLLSSGVTPDITVTDSMINRAPVKERLQLSCRTIRARNAPGSITRSLWFCVQEALLSEKPVRIEVHGEEDIAVLPLMSLAGEGASIAYGLMGKGICVIRTGNKTARQAREILRGIANGK